MKIRITAALAIALALFAAVASAQRFPEGFYVGGSLGYGKAKTFCTDPALAGGTAGCDASSLAWRLLGGYQFNRNFALEGGYHSLGKGKFAGSELTFDAFEASGLFMMPLGDWSLLGRLGFMRGAARGGGAITGRKESNNDITYGAGIQYELSRSFAIRGEWQRYPGLGGPPSFGGDTDVDVWSFGALYRF
jgi:OOP family OmpA-OmpF porin